MTAYCDRCEVVPAQRTVIGPLAHMLGLPSGSRVCDDCAHPIFASSAVGGSRPTARPGCDETGAVEVRPPGLRPRSSIGGVE